MALFKVAEIYNRAREEGYGVAGFCVDGLGTALATIEAAEKARAPVVVVIWQETIRAVGPGYLENIIKQGANGVKVPVAFMLDHATSLSACLGSIICGHSAVMIDASHFPFEENIKLTRQVCEIAHTVDVTVEGELGTIRRSFEKSGEFADETKLTDPSLVPSFVEQTGVDALAVSIGTESGIPSEIPKLDFGRLEKIARSTNAHLVIHGGSGTPHEDIRRAVGCGVTAFRFASELWVAYLDALEAARANLPRGYPDTRYVFGPARKAVENLILERMEHLGCVGRAW
ncbi:class II fructose-bisphosphate aldolase [Chloroflexota bacterium]